MRKAGSAKAGMTLVEVLISSTLGALLLMSLAAATGNVLDAYSASLSEIELSREAADCMDEVAKTIRNATTTTLVSANEISATDGAGDEITFAWSGTPGDPLVMTVAGTDNYDLLPAVQDFTMQLNNTGVETEQDVNATTETLVSFDHYSGGEDWYFKEIGSNDWRGAEFYIPKDEEVEKIKLEQISVRIGKAPGYTGDLQVCLTESRAVNHPIPFGSTLATLDVSNAEIISAMWNGMEWLFFWMTIDLTEGFVVYPNRHYCIYLRGTELSDACMIRVRESDDDPGPDNGIRMFRTTDGGSTWWPTLDEPNMNLYDIPFELTGVKVTRTSQTIQKAHSVDVTLTVKRNNDELTLKRREHLKGGSFKP